METIDIIIHKPLYGSFCYIRDSYIKQAVREKKMLKITTNGITKTINPTNWLQDAKKLEKEFKIKGVPMILWGNDVSKF